MKNRFAGLAFVLGVCCAVPAQATPVQWSLTGLVGLPTGGPGGVILSALYPVGTPFSMLLSFDTFATNFAANPATQGFFTFPGPAAQVTILGQTYFSSLLAFEINCPGAACGTGAGVLQQFNPISPAPTVVRLVMAGAPFTAVSIVDAGGGFITLGCVVCFDGLSYTVTSSSVTAVPEPVSMVLLGTGLAGALLRRKALGLAQSRTRGGEKPAS